MDKERNDLAIAIGTENTEFQYGEYKVTTVFTDNGISLTDALVDYIEKMASLRFASWQNIFWESHWENKNIMLTSNQVESNMLQHIIGYK